MPTVNKLTDHACRSAKPRERPYKLADGAGLALWVSPHGARVWRVYFRVQGRPQTRSLGAYPAVPLAEARRLRDALKSQLAAGTLPERRSAAPTVEAACRDYWAGRQDCTEGYRANALRALELHIWPTLGAHRVDSLTRDAILQPLLRLDAAGKGEYVRKVRVWLSLVLDWCVERGQCQANPADSIKADRAFSRRVVEHHPALDLREVPEFMQRLELEGHTQSALACRLLALTWVRTAELRMMRWDEIDGDLWRLPAGRMKRRRDHLVPLSPQALEVLQVLERRRGGSVYVFPAPHRIDRPMSENAILALLYRMGYRGRMSGHGWRSIGSTWAHEAGYPPDVIERQLAHVPDDKVRAAYNRAEYIDQRRGMLCAFAGWLGGDAA